MTQSRKDKRQGVRYRIRKTISGTAETPRLAVFRSNKQIYAQLIDDVAGNTIVSASSREKSIEEQKINKIEKAKLVGTLIGEKAKEAGVKNAFDFPGFVPAYIRPLFCEGKGPFRWAALSGDPNDILETDKVMLELFPEDKALAKWVEMAQKRISFQGLPARICWLGYGERKKAGLAFNELVKSGKVKAPLVIGRDHLDSGSVASPNRETEGMKDGSDAVADWPILKALLNTASGASWVSFHHGGGVGMGYSLHSGMVVVADGTEEANERLARVLTTDPGTGVMRHVDAGYSRAKQVAKERNVRVGLVEGL